MTAGQAVLYFVVHWMRFFGSAGAPVVSSISSRTISAPSGWYFA
jgi:hypothetical protein